MLKQSNKHGNLTGWAMVCAKSFPSPKKLQTVKEDEFHKSGSGKTSVYNGPAANPRPITQNASLHH
jgi:hypothetical protein